MRSRQREPQQRAAAGRGLCRDGAGVSLGHVADDRQAEARAVPPARRGGPVEAIEDVRQVLGCDPRAVARVVVTRVNTSTRYRGRQNTMFACGGVPRDDDARFRVTGAVRK